MNIVLAISGGIAAYKTPDLVRHLSKRGHSVRCILTSAGEHLVTPQALAAVSGQPVYTSAWTHDGSMPHIDLPRWCDVFLVAPATADVLARCALGMADDLLTTAFLALEPGRRVLFAPAMNTQMWVKPIVQHHVATLSAAGVQMIPPVEGTLACGEQGVGAMAEPVAIAGIVG